ncbi:hypothetical protein, partial [Bartonella sp. AP19HLJMH]|uniref:hypothetical protein n=1 Tax=Bartonella sp. AP19HLJMH TaxID=3243473 RepID=UPI0035CEC8D3
LAILIGLSIFLSHPKGTNNFHATKHQQATFYYPVSLHQNTHPSFFVSNTDWTINFSLTP